jgi:hypothetical protein
MLARRHVMRATAVVTLMLLGLWGAHPSARAEQANDCKGCRDQLQACVKNHSQAACGTEHEICMEHCRGK